jgi:hypothetical protein
MVRRRRAILLLAALLSAAGCRVPVPSRGSASLRAERDRAVARGYAWLARFLEDPRNVDALGVDAVRIFSEPALTMPDQASRERFRRQAARTTRTIAALRMRREYTLSAFDLLDVFELPVHAAALGIDVDPLLGRARAALAARGPADPYRPVVPLAPTGFAGATPPELLDALLAAYSAEKARTFGEDIGLPFDLAGILRVIRARSPGLDPGAESFRDDVYLAAHVGFVASDYGRVRLHREDAPWVYDQLFAAWPATLAARDTELVAEIADVARSLGLSEEDDPLLHAASRFLLDAQNGDGSWGPGPEPGTPYGAMHPTWCAVGGLRERIFLEGTAWEQRVRGVLRALP